MIIVSSDGDFEGPVENADHITLVRSLPELFEALGLEMEAPEIDEFLASQEDKLIGFIDQELTDWGLICDDVLDAEIYESTVNSVELKKLTAFKPIEDGDPILVIGKVDVLANISYTHPDWDHASYDSEDKVLIPFGDVSGDTEVELTIDISMSIEVNEDGEPEEIEELSFRNSDFQWVTFHPFEDYK